MKKFETPEIKTVMFDVEDIITASGGGIETGENSLPFQPG